MQAEQFDKLMSFYNANWRISSIEVEGWRQDMLNIHFDDAMQVLRAIQHEQISSGLDVRSWDSPKLTKFHAVRNRAKRRENASDGNKVAEGCERCCLTGYLAVLTSSDDIHAKRGVEYHDITRFDWSAPLKREYHKKTAPCACDKGMALRKYGRLTDDQCKYLLSMAYSVQRVDAMATFLQLLSEYSRLHRVDADDFARYRADLFERIMPKKDSKTAKHLTHKIIGSFCKN